MCHGWCHSCHDCPSAPFELQFPHGAPHLLLLLALAVHLVPTLAGLITATPSAGGPGGILSLITHSSAPSGDVHTAGTCLAGGVRLLSGGTLTGTCILFFLALLGIVWAVSFLCLSSLHPILISPSSWMASANPCLWMKRALFALSYLHTFGRSALPTACLQWRIFSAHCS